MAENRENQEQNIDDNQLERPGGRTVHKELNWAKQEINRLKTTIVQQNERHLAMMNELKIENEKLTKKCVELQLAAITENAKKYEESMSDENKTYFEQLQSAKTELSELYAAHSERNRSQLSTIDQLRMDNMNIAETLKEEKAKQREETKKYDKLLKKTMRELEKEKEKRNEDARKYEELENRLIHICQLELNDLANIEDVQQLQMNTLRTITCYNKNPYSTNPKLQFYGESNVELQEKLDFLDSIGTMFRFGDQTMKRLKVLPKRAGKITTADGRSLSENLHIDANTPLIFWYAIQVPLIWIEPLKADSNME